MKGTELVLKALVDKGVKYIFGYTGGAIMPVFDEMEKQKKFTFIVSPVRVGQPLDEHRFPRPTPVWGSAWRHRAPAP